MGTERAKGSTADGKADAREEGGRPVGIPIAAVWFADAIVGPQARRVTQVRCNDRDVTALELNLLDQLIIVVDIKGSVHCVPLCRSLGFELLAEGQDDAA